MKIAILGDTHFGARNADPRFSKFFRAFYENVFFPTLQEEGVTTVFQLGDLFDTRKFINLHALDQANDYFFVELQRRDIDFHTLLGNHDIFYRESLDIASTKLLLAESRNIHIYDKPTRYETDDHTAVDIVPWICKENEKDILDFLKNSKSDLLLGHFEIDGFAMYRGMAASGGLSRSVFAKYERVFSGHFHTRSIQDNIHYVGTPYELTWQDAGDPRGFEIFDTETRQLTFVPNPYTIHCRYEYDDTVMQPFPQVKDKFVRIVVKQKTNQESFEKFLDALGKDGAYEIKVIEDLTAYKEGNIDENVDLEDTMTLMSNYVDSVETTADKEKIKDYMKTLYVESLNIEE